MWVCLDIVFVYFPKKKKNTALSIYQLTQRVTQKCAMLHILEFLGDIKFWVSGHQCKASRKLKGEFWHPSYMNMLAAMLNDVLYAKNYLGQLRCFDNRIHSCLLSFTHVYLIMSRLSQVIPHTFILSPTYLCFVEIP